MPSAVKMERSSPKSGGWQERRDFDDDAADESLMEFCKPIEFYNILKHRFAQLPIFLPRTLSYKIEAARLKRIKMTVSVTACLDSNGSLPRVVLQKFGAGQVEGVSVYVMETVPLISSSMGDYWFALGESKLLRAPLHKTLPSQNHGFRDTAVFRLEDIRKVTSRAKRDGSVVLFLILLEHDASRAGRDSHLRTLVNCSGRVLWAKLAMGPLCSSWSNASKEKPLETTHSVDLQHAILQHGDSAGQRGIKLSARGVTGRNGVQLQLCISGSELGQCFTPGGQANGPSAPLVHSPALLSVSRQQPARVIFHFLYGKSNILQQTQDTDVFSCPVCLVSCCSFKGLRCHLNACHDLFHFEYVACENSHVVTVSIRDGVLGNEGVNWKVVGQNLDTPAKKFTYVSRRYSRLKPKGALRRREESFERKSDSLDQGINDRIRQLSVHEPAALRGDEDPFGSVMDQFTSMNVHPASGERSEIHFKEPSPSVASSAEPQPLHQAREEAFPRDSSVLIQHDSSRAAETLDNEGRGGFSKDSRKSSAEKFEARNRAALSRQQFFHSHTAQPMSLEEVFGDEDSEAEVDDEIAAIEDRRLLDEFVDVQPDEKELMHMWNCFVRKHRVLADGHCTWACEAFAKFHAADFARKPSLRWCMLMLLVKLWDHQLVDGGTINTCLRIIDKSIDAAAS